MWDEKKKREPTTVMDDNSHSHNHKHGLSSSEKQRNKGSHESVEKDRMLLDKYSADEKEIGEIRKFNEVDDGAESDSSSDLFELQNYDLGYYSSGLPVYETTNMDSIKRGAPISNGPL